MTTKNYEKVFKQLDQKPAKKAKFIKHNKPRERSCGLGNQKCRRCGTNRGHIKSYKLGFCRRCFRELAKAIGFKKFN